MEKTKEVLTGAKVETSVAAFEQQENPESGCTGKVLVTIFPEFTQTQVSNNGNWTISKTLVKDD